MDLLPKSERKYWDLTLHNRNKRYSEDSKRVCSLLEELMLVTNGNEWLGEIAMKNRNGTQAFQNLRTHYNGSGEHLKRVAEANQILDSIYYKNKKSAFTFEVYVIIVKEAHKLVKDHVELYNDAQKSIQLLRASKMTHHCTYKHRGYCTDEPSNNFNSAVDRLLQSSQTTSIYLLKKYLTSKKIGQLHTSL